LIVVYPIGRECPLSVHSSKLPKNCAPENGTFAGLTLRNAEYLENIDMVEFSKAE
jgi:hypothetical protein